MFIDTSGKGRWSGFALKALVVTAVLAVLLAVAHAWLLGRLYESGLTEPSIRGLETLISDLRSLAVQFVYVWAIVFVGAKFFETRTTFAVSFDRVDAGKVSLRGPDEDNIVWIGHRYASRLEAESVAAAFETRLKESAA